MLSKDHFWRAPDEIPPKRVRGILVVRLRGKVTKAERTAPTRFWRLYGRNYWGPQNVLAPMTWDEFGAEVVAWSIKTAVELREAA